MREQGSKLEPSQAVILPPCSWVSAVGPFNYVILMYDESHGTGQEGVAEGQLKEAEFGAT